MAVIWKMLLVVHQCFWRLHAPELLQEAYHGTAHLMASALRDEPGRWPTDFFLHAL